MTTYASFSDVWNNAATGTAVTVSDGTDQPTGSHNTREYQNWLGRNFDGTLVSKVSGTPRYMMVTLTGYGVTVPVYEPNGWSADNTAANTPIQTLSKYAAVVQCDAGGNPKLGQLPIPVTVWRYQGTTDVSSSSTWSCSATSFSATNNAFSISALPAASAIYFTSTYGGVALSSAMTITKVIDATTAAVSGATTGSGSFTNQQFTHLYTTVLTLSGSFALTKRSGYNLGISGTVSFQVYSSSTDRDGVGYAYAKWQSSPDGVTWTDCGTAVTSDTPCNYSTSAGAGTAGSVTCTYTAVPGLSDGTTYQFRLQLAVDTTANTSMSEPFIATTGGWQSQS